MLKALREEANALAPLHKTGGRPLWSINPNAGTVTGLPNGELICYLHPAAIGVGTLKGSWYLPHDKGST